MKKIILRITLPLIIFSLLAVSCQKVKYDYIDGMTPDERYNEYMEDVRNTLMNGTGWVGYLYGPINNVAFTFYVDFIEKNRVVMYSDLDLLKATTPKESSYNLRNVGTPSLIFDTYNYIHIPADANREVSGGINGEGLNTDYEFSILTYSSDTIRLQGNLNKNEMTLVRIDASEKVLLEEGTFKTTIESFENFLGSHSNNYIDLPGGKQMGVNLSHAAKSFSSSVEEDDGSVTNKDGTYFYSIKGINIINDLSYGSVRLNGGFIDQNNVLYMTDTGGNDYEVKQSNHPITPLSASFGSKGTYTKLHVNDDKLPAGVSSDYTNIFNDIVEKVRSGGYSIQGIDVSLINSTDMLIHIDITSIASEKVHYAEATFDYERDGNTISFSNYRPTDGTGYWRRLESELKDLWEYFNDNSFTIDWAEGSSGDVLGGFYPVSNPDNFFYGILK